MRQKKKDSLNILENNARYMLWYMRQSGRNFSVYLEICLTVSSPLVLQEQVRMLTEAIYFALLEIKLKPGLPKKRLM